MSSKKPTYTPGSLVTVGDLEPGDVIFARRNRATLQPSAPVKVLRLEPSVRVSGLVRVVVQSVHDRQDPWPMGYVPVAREFFRAEPVA